MATNPFDPLGNSATSPFQGPGFEDPYSQIGTGQDNYAPVQPPAQPQPQSTYNQGLRRAYATANPFSSGLLQGVKGLQAGYYGLKGKTEAALGADDWAKQALEHSQRISQQAVDYSPEGAGSLAEARKSGKWGSYIAHTAGSAIPAAAGALGVAGVTAATAGGDAPVLAALTGYGALANAGSGAGDVLQGHEGTLRSRAMKSLAGDVGVGAIQAAPGMGLLSRFGLGAAAADGIEQAVGRPLFQQMVTGAAKQAALGGGANAASTAMQGAVHNWITGDGKDLMSPEALSTYLDATASGAIGGGLLGAAGEAIHGATPTGMTKFQETINAAREKMGKQPLREVPQNEGAPAQPEPVQAEAGEAVQNHLDAIQSAKPLDVTEAGGEAFLSSRGQPTTARLADPERIKAFQGSLGELLNIDKLPNNAIDPLQAAAAAMLPDSAAASGENILPGIKAFAKAVKDGYSSLGDEDLGHLSDYMSHLQDDPQKYGLATRMLATMDGLAQAGKTENLNFAKVVGNEPPIETGADVANEGNLLSSKDWNQARAVSRNIDPSKNVQFGDAPHDMTQLAAAISKSPDMDLGATAMDRRRNAVLYAAQEGDAAGKPMDPNGIRPGLKVFNGEQGVLTPADAKFVRAQLARRGNERGLTPPEESASDVVPRAKGSEPTEGFHQTEQDDLQQRHMGEGDFDNPDSGEALGPLDMAPVSERIAHRVSQQVSHSKTTTEDLNRSSDRRPAYQSDADEKLARRMAERMSLDRKAPLDELYRKANRQKDSPAKTAIMGAIRRAADGNEELTNKLDAVDGRTYKPAGTVTVEEYANQARKAESDARKNTVKAEEGTPEEAPLARAADATGGVLESVKQAMQHPAFKDIAKDLDDLSMHRIGDAHIEQLQGVLNKLSKGFGVPNLKLQLHNRGDTFETEPGVQHNNLDGAYFPRGHVVSLRRGLRPQEAVSTMLHEFGHHMQATLYENLPLDSPVRADIDAAYNDWWSARVNNNFKETVREARAQRAPFFRTIKDVRESPTDRSPLLANGAERTEYALRFEEYFADMTARALYEHEPLNGALREAGGFFQRVAHAMKTLYNLFRSADKRITDAPEAFRKFVRDSWEGQASAATDDTMVQQAAHEDALANSGASFTQGAGAPPPGQGGGGGTPGEGAGWQPGEISHLLNNYDRKTLYHMLVRPDIMKQMVEHANAHMSPYDADQFERAIYRNDGPGMNAVINYGSKLYNEGILRTTEKNLIGALRRFKESSYEALGMKTSDREALNVLRNTKRGTYNKDIDTRTRTEQEIQTGLVRKIGQSRRQGDATQEAIYKGLLTTRKGLAKGELFYENKILPVRNAAMVNMNRRLREIGSPAAMTLAHTLDRITGERGEQSMSSAIQQRVTQHYNRFAESIEGLSDAQKNNMLHALRTQTESTDPAVQAAMAKWYDHAKDVEDYLRASGKDIGHVEKYWPVVLDPKLVTENGGAAFKAMLSDPRITDDMMRGYFTNLGLRAGDPPSVAKANADAMSRQDMVDGFYSMASHSPDVYAHGEALEDGGVPLQPGGAQFRPRVSAFLFQNKDAFPDLLDQFARFQSKNLEQTALPYLKRSIKVAEFHKRFIDPRTKANKLNDIFQQAQNDGTPEAHLKLMRDSVDAALGNLGRGRNGVMDKAFRAIDAQFGTNWAEKGTQAWQDAQKYLITYQNLRTMALGAFGSVIDPLGAWTRSSNLHDAFNGYKAALGKGDSARFFKDQAEMLGIVKRHGMSDLVASMYGDGAQGGLTGKINNALFKYNGQEALSNFSRRMALATAHRFLLRHANGYNEHSSRYLAELGLTPADIRPHATQIGAVDFSNPKVARALYQFVEESVINPRPTQRTGWMNDPNFAVAAQYKNFMYAFYDTIAERIEHEVVNGNYHALAPAAGYLAVAMAADLAKEFVQYGPGGNPNRDDWGPKEYMERAAMRSGLIEPEDQIDYESAMNTLGGSSLPYEALSGPSAEQLHGVLRATFGNGSMARQAEEALPLETVYRGWFN